ncbi:MAG: hydroxyacylglutathione hydrolase [Polyangiaceae bacterium]|nr:hydroxyacylglutathione hydrolase [Polyangiaceae bacterium]
MRVTPILCLRDNYAYLVQPNAGPEALIVDPSEAAPVLRAVRDAGPRIAAVLCTHHHWDHVGGVEELCARAGPIGVYGHSSERSRLPGLNQPLDDGSVFEAAGLSVTALHVPGHTRGSVAYRIEDAVFTGDTLFVAGCGRLFEGTATDMHSSLGRLASLPDQTLVYPGHEYTLNNLQFAAKLEPDNQRIRAKLDRVAEQRRRGKPTVPSSMGEERLTNPFLRVRENPIVRSVSGSLGPDPDDVAVFASVRAAKDRFQ